MRLAARRYGEVQLQRKNTLVQHARNCAMFSVVFMIRGIGIRCVFLPFAREVCLTLMPPDPTKVCMT